MGKVGSAPRNRKGTRRASKQERGNELTPIEVPLDDKVFLLPWFMPKQTYLAVRRILPNIHIAKMRYYFDDYGCIRCERRDVLYRTNGMCESCTVIVRWRLAHCLKKRLTDVGVMPSQSHFDGLGGGSKLAQDLLRSFRSGRPRTG
jgi:hypothetical protein